MRLVFKTLQNDAPLSKCMPKPPHGSTRKRITLRAGAINVVDLCHQTDASENLSLHFVWIRFIGHFEIEVSASIRLEHLIFKKQARKPVLNFFGSLFSNRHVQKLCVRKEKRLNLCAINSKTFYAFLTLAQTAGTVSKSMKKCGCRMCCVIQCVKLLEISLPFSLYFSALAADF